MTSAGRRQHFGLVWLAASCLGPVAIAHEPGSQPASGPASAPASSPVSQPVSRPAGAGRSASTSTSATSSTSSAAVEEPKDEFLAVIHGTVFTITGPVLPDATVLCKNGKIISVGREARLPQECTVIDATGRYVYPGLVAAGASGIHGSSPPEDTTDVYSLSMELALAAGITSALAGEDVAKLTYGETKGMIVRRNVYTDLGQAWRGPLARAELRRDLEKVRGYLRDLHAYELAKAQRDPDAEEPDKAWIKGKFDAYLKLLKKESIGVLAADDQPELVGIAELAREFDFRLVIRGATEAWTVPDVLAQADCGVVLTARNTREPDDRLNRHSGSSIEAARILFEHGVRVAVVPPLQVLQTGGLGGRDLLQLNLEAAYAVRGGMKNDVAVRTITIDAARILGVDDRVGSIEVGKDADLIVTDGDLLHYMTLVQNTIVNGKLVYEKSASSLFSHIRPPGQENADVPQFPDIWPRRLEWPADYAGSRLHSEIPTTQSTSSPTTQKS